MAKEIAGQLKLQIKGGAANPSPPVVPPSVLRVSISWISASSSTPARREKAGKVLPVVITYYNDKSFTFIVKTPPVAVQLLEAAKVKSGSAQPNRNKVAELTWDQVKTIAEDKMPDLNCSRSRAQCASLPVQLAAWVSPLRETSLLNSNTFNF